MGIEDFGEKIGGARKDLANLKNMTLHVEDVEAWTDLERKELINKKTLWKPPDYQSLVENGMPVELALYIKSVRDAIPVKPFLHSPLYENRYIAFVGVMKDSLLALQSTEDIESFFNEKVLNKYVKHSWGTNYIATEEGRGCIDNKLLRALCMRGKQLTALVQQKQFLYTEEDKLLARFKIMEYNGENVQAEKDRNGNTILVYREGGSRHYYYHNSEHIADLNQWKPGTFFYAEPEGIIEVNLPDKEAAKTLILQKSKNVVSKEPTPATTRKQRLLPPQLAEVRRVSGMDYRNKLHATGDYMIHDFGFRGGEFGNWESQLDRQTNLDMSYDAFRDLAFALGIEPKDMALGGKLAIAFGARGHSAALAHFEPMSNVINLTKMKGAGSLAHEWGHAVDFYVAQQTRLRTTYATESRDSLLAPVVRAMKYKTDNEGKTVYTDFYLESNQADILFAKEDKGYWSSNVEMFARSFACYIKDQLREQNTRDDFLCGHADATVYPKGQERLFIGKAIQEAVKEMCNLALLHPVDLTVVHQLGELEDAVRMPKEYRLTRLSDTGYVSDVSNEGLQERYEQLSLVIRGQEIGMN